MEIKSHFQLSDKAECFNESSFHNAHKCPNQEDCERWYSEEDVKILKEKLKEDINNLAISDKEFTMISIWDIIDSRFGNMSIKTKDVGK